MKTDEFVKQINNLRLQNKNKWYTYQGTVNNKNRGSERVRNLAADSASGRFDRSNRGRYFGH